jgi:hypothetical protein
MAAIKINFTLKTTEEIFWKKDINFLQEFYLIKMLQENMTLNNAFIMRCLGIANEQKSERLSVSFASFNMYVEASRKNIKEDVGTNI